MRDGEDLAARLLLIAIHIIPQLIRRCADERGIGLNLIGLVFAVAHDDDAVQVIALPHQRIFKAVKGGEFARRVVAFGDLGVVVPNACLALQLVLGVEHLWRQRPLGEAVDEFHRDGHRLLGALVQLVMPALEKRIAQQEARCIVDRLQCGKPVRMVGDDKEVERPGELSLQACGGGDFFAHGKAQGVFRSQTHAEAKRVGGVGGVKMGVAEIDLLGIFGFLDLRVGLLARDQLPCLLAGGQRQTQ